MVWLHCLLGCRYLLQASSKEVAQGCEGVALVLLGDVIVG